MTSVCLFDWLRRKEKPVLVETGESGLCNSALKWKDMGGGKPGSVFVDWCLTFRMSLRAYVLS